MALRRLLAPTVSALALALTAPAALAAERYAAPAGAGADCTQAAPCSLSEALDGSTSGDEIIVASGDYGAADASFSDHGRALYVHGVPGQPLPRIFSAVGGGTAAVSLVSPDSRIAHVEIRTQQTEGTALWSNAKSIDHVRIETTAPQGIAISNGTGSQVSITNTAIHGTSDGAEGIYMNNVSFGAPKTVTVAIGHVTVVMEGQDTRALSLLSIGVGAGGQAAIDATVSNSILRAQTKDVLAQADGANDSVTIVLDHSNFASSITYGSGAKSISYPEQNDNQTATPLFADLPGGNLREAEGSPTIDAGIADPLAGTTDLAGNARAIGSAPDIGAYEFAPATPPANDGDGGGSGSGDGSGSGGGSGSGAGDGGGLGSGGATPPVVVPISAPDANGSGSPAGAAKRCVVPRLTGKTLKAARAALAKAGCRAGKVKTRRVAKRAGKVVAQGAKPGKRLRAGSKVTLVVGRR